MEMLNIYSIFVFVHFFDGVEGNRVVSIFKRFGIRLEINDLQYSVNIDSKFIQVDLNEMLIIFKRSSFSFFRNVRSKKKIR